jgi:H+/Cl- antiporter ClcA
VQGGPVPVAALQALMKCVHRSQQNRQHKIELVQRQAPMLVGLLIAAVVFFAAWALAGGFEWLLHEEVEVTLAMVLVTGVLLGFFGGLLSVAFSTVRADLEASILELRWNRAITLARPFIGAAVAVPIVLFLQSGLINLGSVTPALALALCFIGGFSERWFLAQVERIAGTAERKST